MSEKYRRELVYKSFLLFVRMKESDVCDKTLRERTLETIRSSGVDKVVCLALDPVYEPGGARREDLSHVWVDNDYVLDLRKELPDRILLGASVHPYDPAFKDRVKKYVDEGAVLLKWIPSSQQINLAEEKTATAMKFLATAGPGGKPLPLLLHVGPEFAIPSSDERTNPYNYLHWSGWDSFLNFMRFGKKWHVPKVKKIHQNLESALNEGTTIIFAHCGLPYFFAGFLGGIFEHSEFKEVRTYLERAARGEFKGECYADVSALATPFRKAYFESVRNLPPDRLLFGSDFPTPIFELSADTGEMARDFKAMMKGDLSRIIVPQDNLLDVNHRELRHYFPDHPMFTNFSRLGLG